MSGCPVCAELEAMPPRERYIMDPRLSHCRECHASWGRGTKTQHCTKCHRTFSAVSASDQAHTSRRDAAGELRRVCRDPAEVGLAADPNHWGAEVWHGVGNPRFRSRS